MQLRVVVSCVAKTLIPPPLAWLRFSSNLLELSGNRISRAYAHAAAAGRALVLLKSFYKYGHWDQRPVAIEGHSSFGGCMVNTPLGAVHICNRHCPATQFRVYKTAHVESVIVAIVVESPRTYSPPPKDVAVLRVYTLPDAVALRSWYSTAPPPAPDASVACSELPREFRWHGNAKCQVPVLAAWPASTL